MLSCQKCGAALEIDSDFCIMCGTPVERSFAKSMDVRGSSVVCTKCSASIEPDSMFCTSCGTPVAQSDTSSEESKKTCTNCGSLININEKFCVICGQMIADAVEPIGTKSCPQCGTQVDDDSQFCWNCRYVFNNDLGRCQNCGGILNPHTGSCDLCGYTAVLKLAPEVNKRLDEMSTSGSLKCTHCGAFNESDSQYCVICGKSISDTDVKVETTKSDSGLVTTIPKSTGTGKSNTTWEPTQKERDAAKKNFHTPTSL